MTRSTRATPTAMSSSSRSRPTTAAAQGAAPAATPACAPAVPASRRCRRPRRRRRGRFRRCGMQRHAPLGGGGERRGDGVRTCNACGLSSLSHRMLSCLRRNVHSSSLHASLSCGSHTTPANTYSPCHGCDKGTGRGSSLPPSPQPSTRVSTPPPSPWPICICLCAACHCAARVGNAQAPERHRQPPRRQRQLGPRGCRRRGSVLRVAPRLCAAQDAASRVQPCRDAAGAVLAAVRRTGGVRQAREEARGWLRVGQVPMWATCPRACMRAARMA